MKYRLFVLLFSTLLMVSLNGCNNKKDGKLSASLIHNPNTADGSGDLEDLPKIVFATTSHDFGELQQGETAMYAFKFKNEGKSDLLISEATSGCKCTSTKYPKEVIKPGEEGRIEVTFDPTGIRGFQHKMITVVTNGQPNVTPLYVKANVKFK